MIDSLFEWAQQDWIVTIAVIIVVALVGIAIVRAMFKIALILLVVGVVMVMVFGFTTDEVLDMGRDAASVSTEFYEKSAKPFIEGELDGYDHGTDGDEYFITTSTFEIRGEKDASEATVTYGDGEQFVISVEELEEMFGDQIDELEEYTEDSEEEED